MAIYIWKDDSVGAWIYRNPTAWLISISDDWENWITIADKNLWATQVYNNGDTENQNNCGNLYQRGNNYWFPIDDSQRTVSWTKVDTTWYWPGNYYSSSTFIAQWNDWSDPSNSNLRWDDTNTFAARQWPCPSWRHVPSWDWDQERNPHPFSTTVLMVMMENLWLTEYRDYYTVITTAAQKNFLLIPNGYYWIWTEYYWQYYWVSQNLDSPRFWTSTQYASIDTNWVPWTLKMWMSWYEKYRAYHIRPFKNVPVEPDNTRTILFQPS